VSDGIIIAGGGLAGAACAVALTQAGRQVTVIERETVPRHKICGEFLSTEAQAYLSSWGIDVSGIGGAPISRLRLTRGKTSVETPLPFHGLGISRCRLDEAVLQHAERAGARVLRGRTITHVDKQSGGRLALADGDTIVPDTLFLATGKHELRGARRDVVPPEKLIGFKMYFTLAAAATAELAGRIELILFRGGYAGLQMVEDGMANLCLLTDRTRFQLAGGCWEALLHNLCAETPLLAHLLAHGKPLLEEPLTIYRVPYGFIHRPQLSDSANLYRLGDQAGVIPSFTGDGMAIALHSVAVATSMFIQGSDAAAYHRRLARDIGGQIKRAGFFYALANAGVSKHLFLSLVKLFPGSLKIGASLTRVPVRVRRLAV
jgi:flavin-dependent dehydrogenase